MLISAAAINYIIQSGYNPFHRKISSGVAEFHFIDVGQGDASLILSDDVTIMIDTGANSAEYKLTDYLDELKIKKIDILFLTHPDEDHIGNADTVISKYNVGCVVYPDITDTGLSFEFAMDACDNTETLRKITSVGDIYKYGDLQIRVIWPMAGSNAESNEYSLVLLVTHGDNRLLYSADIDAVSEVLISDFWGDFIADCDILKVAHHGSSGSSSLSFINSVNPQYAIISCGKNNSFGHPAIEVTERLTAIECEIHRTDKNGSIVFVSDKSKLTLK